ncbi:uridine diphosphate-N-acetylglucosamine-binding protein YvcK [Dermabacter sp. Marseille-Q3180]|uniref:gluconeogenesis factor YvcK family protein n=1 Tax=Dermabacter sp. Marseille-Q3180 TaxID=2758090 RepID=UPI001CC2A061|nr:uridine diphosphate-N-acetylglucosamine-binding protein YvcK [Dermabacter sp. Marseille-Q3180]
MSANVPRRTSSLMPTPLRSRTRGPKVVAFGGGHGLSASLNALRHLTRDLTAVVTVADNGGSSGRLRAEMPILPPGDLRMALSALCEDSEWGVTWRDVVQHRFTSEGDMDGHSLGNFLIVALWQLLDDPIAALDYVGELLGTSGRVLPMALEPLDIEALVSFPGEGTRTIRGQADVAATTGHVETLRVIPPEPAIAREVLDSIDEAEWLVIGPGSWYTSVLPHVKIPELREAIEHTKARKILTMNLAAGRSETVGLTGVDLLNIVCDAAPGLAFDALIADPSAERDGGKALTSAAHERGIDVLMRMVSTGDGTPTHDPLRLATAYRDVFNGVFTHPRKD